MLDIIQHITINDKQYPIAYTLNVMEAIQEKYGTIEKWANALEPTEKVIDELTGKVKIDKETGREIVKALEPKIKDIKWTFTQFINEGIDIENEEKIEKRPFVTEKQVGRLISAIGMDKVNEKMMSITAESMKTESPNEATTQNQMSQ